MGRKSLLDTIKETIKIPNNRDHTYMLAYDFPGFTPSPHYYKVLSNYMEELEKEGAQVERIQSSIIVTNDLHGFITMTRLAQHYDAQIYTCMVQEQPPDQIQLQNVELVISPEERATLYWITARYNTDKTRKQVPDETTQILETLYGIRYGLKLKIHSTNTNHHKIIKDTAENQPKYTQPYTLTGNQVLIALEALQKHLTHTQTGQRAITAYSILWRLNNKQEPPEATPENIQALLSEQPVQVWINQYL